MLAGNPGGNSVVCPEELPVCAGYVYDHNWGTCMPRSNAGSVDVTVAQPCGYLGNIKVGGCQPLRIPAFVENVFELLGSELDGHPGEFYLDSAAGFVYYVPRAGETPASVVGQLPVVEMLVDAEGVSDVSYHGVTFEHATWMRPSTGWGFVDVQAGWTLACAVGDPCSGGSGEGQGEQSETPSALSFRSSSGVNISSCTFRCARVRLCLREQSAFYVLVCVCDSLFLQLFVCLFYFVDERTSRSF